MAQQPSEGSFLARNQFLIRRLFSLCGLVPVGAYMCIHLLTNATVLNGAAAFQDKVYLIHSLGMVLPLVEWTFIFIPLIFHAVMGLYIASSAEVNASSYPYGSNIRYTLQRLTGMIAFVFIFWHVFHMHGWIHAESWMEMIRTFAGGLFRPFNAASTAAAAIQASIIVQILYAIGVLATVYHLANGIWGFGITWGLWTSEAAMKRASYACGVFGILLGFVGLSALWGMSTLSVEQAWETENSIYEAKVESGELAPNEHKRALEDPAAEDEEAPEAEPAESPQPEVESTAQAEPAAP